MQVFVPYPSPIDVARCLDRPRLLKQITECKQILAAITGKSKGWKNHPVVKMYENEQSWLKSYRLCLDAYYKGDQAKAEKYSLKADEERPLFLTTAFCDQHKRRLYTRAPQMYSQFSKFGASEENWYYIDGEIVKYIDGNKYETQENAQGLL